MSLDDLLKNKYKLHVVSKKIRDILHSPRKTREKV